MGKENNTPESHMSAEIVAAALNECSDDWGAYANYDEIVVDPVDFSKSTRVLLLLGTKVRFRCCLLPTIEDLAHPDSIKKLTKMITECIQSNFYNCIRGICCVHNKELREEGYERQDSRK